MKNAFRSASSIHQKGLGLEMQSLVLGLNTRLGLGLEIKFLVFILVLKKCLLPSGPGGEF